MADKAASLLLALACFAYALGVAAQPTPDESNARFDEGLALFESGKNAEAAAVWEALLRDMGPERGWKLSYNLGLAYEAAGQTTLAVERFGAFIARVAASVEALPPELEERREDAASRVRAIKAAYAELHLPASTPGVTVSIDGEPARPAGYSAFVQPGRHAIVVTGPKGAVRRTEVDALAGRHFPIDTSDPTPPPPKPPPPEPIVEPNVVFEDDPPEFPLWWVVGGAAATGLSFTLVGALYGEAATRRDEAVALGSGHTGYPAAIEAYEDGRRSYQLSYLLPAALGAVTLTIATVGIVRIAIYEPTQTALVFSAGGPRVEGSF